MSKLSVSPAQRLLLAFALVALKHKPPGLSYETYILELRRCFGNAATEPPTEESDAAAWRKRALELEAEIHGAKTSEISEAIVSILRRPPSPSAENDAREPTSRGGRKRTKKLDSRRTQALDISSTATEKSRVGGKVISSGTVSSLGTIRGFFSSLHDIATLSATASASPVDAARVVAATVRCIDVLCALLVGITSTEVVSPVPEDTTPQDVINTIEHILQHILHNVIPALQDTDVDACYVYRLQWHANPVSDEFVCPPQITSAVDLVLLHIMRVVLIPAIRSLAPCTLAKMELVLSAPQPEPPKKRDLADGAQLLSLISVTLGALHDQRYIILYDYVALEAVRELTSLVKDWSSHGTHARLTPAQRFHRIASKDALHHLCDAVLLALRRSTASVLPGSREETPKAMLAKALGDLALTQCIREGVGSGLDVVEEQRVMVVLERAWSVGLRIGNIGEDVDNEKMDGSRDGALE